MTQDQRKLLQLAARTTLASITAATSQLVEADVTPPWFGKWA